MGIIGASWKTTVIGFVGALFNYFVTLGPNLPVTKEDWIHAMTSALIFAFGATVKDANVSNAPKPVAAQAVSAANEATVNPATKG